MADVVMKERLVLCNDDGNQALHSCQRGRAEAS